MLRLVTLIGLIGPAGGFGGLGCRVSGLRFRGSGFQVAGRKITFIGLPE